MKIIGILRVVACLATVVILYGCTTTVVEPGARPVRSEWNTPTLHCWINYRGVRTCRPREY